MHQLEQLILVHCAPVLCGVKPASIISCCKYEPETIDAVLDTARKQLVRHGCLLLEVCRCEHHITLFVYHRWILTAFINAPGVPQFLALRGYPVTEGVDGVVEALLTRYQVRNTVPHEVGVFLGYPLADVVKFEKFKGRNYKLCRYWKVYTGERQAERVFDCYDQCRAKVGELISDGLPFAAVLKEIA